MYLNTVYKYSKCIEIQFLNTIYKILPSSEIKYIYILKYTVQKKKKKTV